MAVSHLFKGLFTNDLIILLHGRDSEINHYASLQMDSIRRYFKNLNLHAIIKVNYNEAR